YFSTAQITPGAANLTDPIADPTRNVLINEIMYNSPLTGSYTSVTNAGGFARFNVTSTAGLYVGAQVTIATTGGTSYAGEYTVTALTAQSFTTGATFSSTSSTGTWTAEADAYEYVELVNRSLQAVNVNGWKFTSGVNFVLPNYSIPVNGYLVGAANVPAFNAKYPGVTNVVGDWVG